MNTRSLRSADGTFRMLQPDAWARLADTISRWPRTRLVEQNADSLRAECRSRVFGFVDDLTIERSGDIATAHAEARRGLYDFGVNARRLAHLRQQLRGVVS
ncbi:MAG: DUF1499 domain-containing protein [Verrucomicrobiota bacterium]|nr:DUF1499 domain-containing protein [Verrucomicrobiota bacterium]